MQKTNLVTSWKIFVVFLAVTFFSATGTAQEFVDDEPHKGYGAFTRVGYKFELAESNEIDTDYIEDPITGDVIAKPRPKGRIPAIANGKKIYKLSEVTTPAYMHVGTMPLEEYIIEHLKDNIRQWAIDSFTVRMELKDVIIDEKGKVIYFELLGLHGWRSDDMLRTLNSGNIPDSIQTLLGNAPLMKPAMYKGKVVPAYTGVTLDHYEIIIHKPDIICRKVFGPYRGTASSGINK